MSKKNKCLGCRNELTPVTSTEEELSQLVWYYCGTVGCRAYSDSGALEKIQAFHEDSYRRHVLKEEK